MAQFAVFDAFQNDQKKSSRFFILVILVILKHFRLTNFLHESMGYSTIKGGFGTIKGGFGTKKGGFGTIKGGFGTNKGRFWHNKGRFWHNSSFLHKNNQKQWFDSFCPKREVLAQMLNKSPICRICKKEVLAPKRLFFAQK